MVNTVGNYLIILVISVVFLFRRVSFTDIPILGALRYIRTLKFWPLKRVMIEKYLYPETESVALCDFLEPMLAIDMRERAYARDMKNHKWLQPSEIDEPVVD